MSNFEPDRLIDLIEFNQVVPAVNQIETHLLCQRRREHEWLEKYQVRHMAYAPFMVSTAFSTSFLAVCLILANALQHVPAIGYRALFICKPISWAIIAGVNYIYYFKGFRMSGEPSKQD